MKKIIFSMALVLFFINNCRALSYQGTFKGGLVIDGVYVKKIDKNGNVEDKKAQFIVNSENEFVYCLEPFVKVKLNTQYDIYEEDYLKVLNMSEEMWKRINLLAYYGYLYKDNLYDHTDYKWYYITQMLIWRSIDNEGKFYFTTSFKGNIDENLFAREILEIENLVRNHDVIPEFQVPSLYVGDDVTLLDKKGVLNNFEVTSKNAIIENNNISFKVISEEMIISLSKKEQESKPLVYISEDSQNILIGRASFPVQANYLIKATLPVGSIKIIKYGEKVKIDKEEFYYYYDFLANIKFNLYDQNNTLIESKYTDQNGEVIFDNLPVGKYIIKEENCNSNYVINDDVYEVELSKDDNNKIISKELKIKNHLKKGQIIILKKDFNTNKPLANTKFGLYKDDALIYSGYTNEEGYLKIDNLPFGHYKIVELEANEGYILNEEVQDITLDDSVWEKKIEIFNIPDTEIIFNIEILYADFKKKLRMI